MKPLPTSDGSVLAVLLTIIIGSCFLIESLEGTATPRNIREIFIGRCWEYQQVIHPQWIQTPKNCTALWNTFQSAFVGKDPCETNDTSYAEFIQAAYLPIDNEDRVLFWSGSVVPLVYDYTIDARRMMTIRDTLYGYIAKNIEDWCGKNDTSNGGQGMDFDQCPSWYTCPGYPAKMSASQAFWRSASEAFALSAQGEVHVLLNGSSGQAFRNESTFTDKELASLEASRNPVLQVWLIHDVVPSNRLRETCENGTLVHIKAVVLKKGMTFNCIEDPEDLLHFQCVDNVGAEMCNFRADSAAPLRSKSTEVIAFVIVVSQLFLRLLG